MRPTSINICDCPEPEQQEMEADKNLWFKAVKMLQVDTRSKILSYISQLPKSGQADFKRRLNTIKGHIKNV